MSTTVSVLICTRNRAQDLTLTLPTVLANTYPDYEVVVVDQSDGGETQEIVTTLQADHPRLRYVRTETRGVALCRNAALAAAQGEILAFVDDDCQTQPDWVERIVFLFREDTDLDIVFGQVHSLPGLPAEVVVPCLYFNRRQVLKRGRVMGMNANMGLRRSALERIDCYDAALGHGGILPGGEEFDFCYRAQQAGLKVVVDPRLVLIHRAFRRPAEWQRVMSLYGQGDAAFYLKHIRCGDGLAVLALARYLGLHLRRLAGEMVKNLLRRPAERRNYSAAYVRALMRGLVTSWRYPVDRRRRLYVLP